MHVHSWPPRDSARSTVHKNCWPIQGLFHDLYPGVPTTLPNKYSEYVLIFSNKTYLWWNIGNVCANRAKQHTQHCICDSHPNGSMVSLIWHRAHKFVLHLFHYPEVKMNLRFNSRGEQSVFVAIPLLFLNRKAWCGFLLGFANSKTKKTTIIACVSKVVAILFLKASIRIVWQTLLFYACSG